MEQNEPHIKNIRETTTKRIIKAVEESQGLLTLAAKKAGISYTTIQRYRRDNPTVAQAIEEARERTLDFAEGKLMENIRNGDNTAIIFYLKTQGKHRGYVERVESTGKDGGPITLVSDMTDEQLRNIAAGRR